MNHTQEYYLMRFFFFLKKCVYWVVLQIKKILKDIVLALGYELYPVHPWIHYLNEIFNKAIEGQERPFPLPCSNLKLFVEA